MNQRVWVLGEDVCKCVYDCIVYRALVEIGFQLWIAKFKCYLETGNPFGAYRIPSCAFLEDLKGRDSLILDPPTRVLICDIEFPYVSQGFSAHRDVDGLVDVNRVIRNCSSNNFL